MKRIIVTILKRIIAAILLTALLLMPFTVNANRTVEWKTKISGKTYYATVLKITKIDRKKNKVYCKNWCGYPYQFTGVEDLEKGDNIACIMWTNFTSDIRNDIVVAAKFQTDKILEQK